MKLLLALATLLLILEYFKMSFFASLARQAGEEFVRNNKVLALPLNLPEELLKKKAGVFVTIQNKDELRGCIGTYLPTQENLAQEIIANAISVVSEDYRFSPVSIEELPELSYTVSVLSNPELVTDIKNLNPQKYGILVKALSSPKSGLLLPCLKKIDTIQKQISVACEKGGINPFEEKIAIYRFTVEKHEE